MELAIITKGPSYSATAKNIYRADVDIQVKVK